MGTTTRPLRWGSRWTARGSVYVTGSFEDAISFGGGAILGSSPSVFVAKLSP